MLQRLAGLLLQRGCFLSYKGLAWSCACFAVAVLRARAYCCRALYDLPSTPKVKACARQPASPVQGVATALCRS